jgi:hypothetical protein
VRTIASIGACVVALATAGCGASSGPGSTTTTPPAQTQPPPATEAPANTETPANEPPAQQWQMPNLTGAVLQDAQDQIQTLTAGAVYFTDSHDLTGQGRHQVMDDNWRICTQNVAPGAALTATSKIDFGVVKLDETCP